MPAQALGSSFLLMQALGGGGNGPNSQDPVTLLGDQHSLPGSQFQLTLLQLWAFGGVN